MDPRRENPLSSASRVSLQVPVTAAAFLRENLILIGHGNEMEIFDVSRRRMVCQAAVLPAGVNINGIFPGEENPDRFVVHGDRFLAFCRLEYEDKGDQRARISVKAQALSDWIVSSTYLPANTRGADPSVAVVTAHNQLFVIDLNTFSNVQESHCEDQSVIICGKAVHSTCGIFVVAGTMFSEVVIWRPVEDRPAPVLHRLKGHAGVLFSIDLSPSLTSIVSASDDRTICVWHADNPEIPLSHPDQKFNLIGPLFGHDARVWRASFLDSIIVSVGEDSRVCVWDSATGERKRSFIAHGGASIRCLAVKDRTLSRMTPFITGGLDGGVKLFPTWQDVPKTQIPLLRTDGDQIRSVHCIDESGAKLLLGYVSGRLCVANSPDGLVELSLDESELLKSYACLDVIFGSLKHGDHFRLAAGGLSGKILVARFAKTAEDDWKCDRVAVDIGKEVLCNADHSKVCLVKWLTEDCILVSTAAGSSFTIRNPSNFSEFCLLHGEDAVQRKGDKWVTAAAISSCGEFLMAGYRNGDVRLFRKGATKGKEFGLWIDVGSGPSKIFGKHGVTCLRFDRSRRVFWGCGRNGIICAWRASYEGLQLIEKIDWKYDWVGGIFFHDNELRIVSFHSRMFVVQNQRGDEVMRADCGGGHRSWDFALKSDGLHALTRFYYIKDGDLYLETVSPSCFSSPAVLREAGARTTVNAASLLASDVLVLGTEGGTVSFVQLDHETSTFSSVGQSLSHLSSVKAVAVVEEGAGSFLLAFGGGRALVVLYRLSVSECAAKSHQTKEVFSRKMAEVYAAAAGFRSVSKKKHKPWLNSVSSTTTSSECRVNSLHFPNARSLLAGFSDGYLRSYSLKKAGKSDLELLWEMELESCAVTRCLALGGGSEEDEEGATVVCGGSDGVIRVIKNGKNVVEWTAHPAGVSCLDAAYHSPVALGNGNDSLFLVASGGDDHAVSLSLLGLGTNGIVDSATEGDQWARSTARNTTSSSCQISGVMILGRDCRLASCSLDQRVTLWSYDITRGLNQPVKLKPMWSILTNVADIHGLVATACRKNDNERCANVVVVGCGMEWIRCRLDV